MAYSGTGLNGLGFRCTSLRRCVVCGQGHCAVACRAKNGSTKGEERSPQGGTGGFYFKINLMLKGFTRHTASKHTHSIWCVCLACV